ncbi:MAG TPA: nicotinate (nicotinamide) nucleotide adenylyltransferase [Puia sp.]|nr:nicotinate (nicotinamide) nucleotide adenylyltransferase [Puia sp.]
MNIGLYFGSFNPVHIGHLILANHVANNSPVEQVWFMVSPQNPLKPANSLLNEYQRLHLVRLAVGDDPQLKASDAEFHLPRPSYTTDTLAYLEEKYPQHRFYLILGSDSFTNIQRWKNASLLLERYPFLVYKRPGFEITTTWDADLTIMDAPLLQISATAIREAVHAGKSIRYLVPDAVREEIERGHYYK